jgi:hypothetical protein
MNIKSTEITLFDGAQSFMANTYPILASYSAESLPLGVAPPLAPCAACQGLDFKDQPGDNEILVNGNDWISGYAQKCANFLQCFSQDWKRSCSQGIGNTISPRLS